MEELREGRPQLAPLALPANDVPSSVPLEIERKWLLQELPDLDRPPLAGAQTAVIKTTFLIRAGDWKERVRKVTSLDGVRYYHTQKRRLHDIVQEEVEREIDRREYRELKRLRDPERSIIRKTRLTFPYQGHRWELDLYEEPSAPPRLEVELADASERPTPPPLAVAMVEVSSDRRYSDRSLAKYGLPAAPGVALEL